MKLVILNQSAVAAAQSLLGWQLYSTVGGQQTAGLIIETEAYTENDPASHSYKGLTKRNQPMFGEAGRAYVYQIYGLHYCINVVTGKEGLGEAVLIRAILPMVGLDTMKKRRRQANLANLTNGPSKLAQSLQIDKALNYHLLTKQPLWLASPRRQPPVAEVVAGPRVGIKQAQDYPWNFSLTPRERIYQLVSLLPQGKVATYQLLATLVGLKSPRSVGTYLHQNPDPKNIPCHRVVNGRGQLAGNFAFGGLAGQKRRLAKEGVVVERGRVDLAEYLWTS